MSVAAMRIGVGLLVCLLGAACSEELAPLSGADGRVLDAGVSDAGATLDAGMCGVFEVLPDRIIMGPEARRSLLVLNREAVPLQIRLELVGPPEVEIAPPAGTYTLAPAGQLEVTIDATLAATPWEGWVVVADGCRWSEVHLQRE